jgi:hypothetical protein
MGNQPCIVRSFRKEHSGAAHMTDATFTRREGLGLAALGLGAAAIARPALAATATPGFLTEIDFKNPKWNRDTYVRLDADLDPSREKVGWVRGKAFGVRDNEKIRTLFDVDGFSVVRTQRLPDGSWRRLLREVMFYRDPETHEILKTWHNPYTDETVRIVPIANDPFNYTISEFAPEPPSYGGLNKDKPARKPLLLDWEHGADGTLVLRTGVDMMYPSALQPDKWPRESAGPMNRVSEHFVYVFKRADAENPRLTHIPHQGSWARVTPWLPWMLMGQAPGHVNYFCTFATVPQGIAGLPQDLVAAARAMGEKWLHAPTEDYGPSLSSLENYARTQKPAPVPAGWTPPQPPSAAQ